MKFPIPVSLILFIISSACNEKTTETEHAGNRPNIIIIFADDLGYGDLGCFGSTIKTPHLDRMAAEGQKWNNFYASASVCTPSRAGLQTGRLPVRTGMCSDQRRVLFPDSGGGLPQSEVTIARKLKEAGYSTACIGKWHLGHLKPFLPTSHGYDYYYGIPYSNDMDRIEGIDHYEACIHPENEYFKVPLMENETVLSREVDQRLLTRNYTHKALEFIDGHKDSPFFIYLAHSMPHVPLFRSETFEGVSKRGIYGDVLEEIDWSVGEIRQALEKHGIAGNTLVVFTSDNGPWVIFREHAGSAGMLYGAKGTCYEGGMREPTVFWWPGKLREGVVSEMGSALDLFPTICSLAGVKIPDDRVYDGHDISPVLFDRKPSARTEMFYYHGTRLFAVRKGDFKLLWYKNNPEGYPEQLEKLDNPQLFNISVDPGEKYDIADRHPDVIAEIETLAAAHQAALQPAESQLEIRIRGDEAGYENKSL